MKKPTIEQIESVLIKEVGEMVSKRLKHLPNLHPQTNTMGLIIIDGEYYKWEYTKLAMHGEI
jgi:hypothetical protein